MLKMNISIIVIFLQAFYSYDTNYGKALSVGRLKEIFYELKCIQYGNFKLASGGTSNYKIICDPLFENSESREIIGTLGYKMLKGIENGKDYEIVGVVTGGYEFAKLVAEKSGRKAVGINPHNGEVIGKVVKEDLCYFEDVVTKGGSILKCRNILGKNDGKDNHSISIVDRQEGGEENLRKNGIRLYSILTKSHLGIAL
jgi:orotate phosphoribosyltransferase